LPINRSSISISKLASVSFLNAVKLRRIISYHICTKIRS